MLRFSASVAMSVVACLITAQKFRTDSEDDEASCIDGLMDTLRTGSRSAG